MSSEDELSKIKDIAEAVATITDSVPIYQDAIQPAAKEVGKGLEVVGKVVNRALDPLRAMIWGYDQICDYVVETVSKQLENYPEDKIKTPPPNIAVPAIEGLRYTAHDKELRKLFALLLATSMKDDLGAFTHPSYVEFIKQMTSDEARLLKYFKRCYDKLPFIDVRLHAKDGSHKKILDFCINDFVLRAGCNDWQNANAYLRNLVRMGLIELHPYPYLDKTQYEVLKKSFVYLSMEKNVLKNHDDEYELKDKFGHIELTVFGWKFCEACLDEDDLKQDEASKQGEKIADLFLHDAKKVEQTYLERLAKMNL
jgi:hypothetical protein